MNLQLSNLKLVPSNLVGATRLVSKVAAHIPPTLEELRPITLLNTDYKLLTRILSKRISKVLHQVIRSSQSCGVKDANICSSACNLLSLIEAVQKSGKAAAIMSLDLFKAYDRTNLTFLKRVMSAMNFSDKFISWILLLHEGAKTRLLLDFLTEPIDVLFSVRQGDPLAMILFILYIEPLFMK